MRGECRRRSRKLVPWAWATLPALLCVVGTAAAQPTTSASWIWYPEEPAIEGVDQTRYLRRVVLLPAAPVEAHLRARWDDAAKFTINGQAPPVLRAEGAAGVVYDLAPLLREDENVLAFEVYNAIGVGGLIVNGTITLADGAVVRLFSDETWRASRESAPGWELPGFDDADWPAARVVGGVFALPWYRHPAFDMEPFLEPNEMGAYQRWAAARTALPPGLEAEAPAVATLTQEHGQAVLRINGQARPALMYRGSIDPLTDHGRRQIGIFRDAGVRTYSAYYNLAQAWTAPDEHDFSRLDEIIRGYLSADPEAYIHLILRLTMPNWWMDAHPEEMVRYAAGDDFNSSDESYRVRRPSLASEAWQQAAMDLWRRCITHLEEVPWGRRVIGYQPGYGIYTEWHYFGSWTNQMPDTGPAMTRHFRRWLAERYGTDARLQAAWRDPDVTLATAQVPGAAPRLAAGPLGLRDPAHGTWVMDYYRCQQELTADCVEMFCAEAKRLTGGRVIAGAFYGYYNGVPPQTQGGHLELARLLRSDACDYFAAPYDYSHRLMGDDGRTRALVDAFAFAGKVHMIEDDTRTHLHGVDEYGRAPTEAATIAAMRRMMGTALTHGAALWWCDFGPATRGGWYDDPALGAELAGLHDLAARRLQRPASRVAQVLLVADLHTCYHLGDGPAMRTHYSMVDQVTGALHRTGAPFDAVLLDQLGDLDLDPYRLIVFMGCLRVDADTRAVVRRATEGRTVVWIWAPGITDGARFGPELVTDLTGFVVELDGEGVAASEAVVDGDEALTSLLPEVARDTLTVTATAPVEGFAETDNWYNPRDADTMKRYTAFDLTAEDGGIAWTVGTYDTWSDVHLRARIEACDGVGVTVWGEGEVAGAALRVVVKDVEDAEYVSATLPIEATPTEHRLALSGFAWAPWRRGEGRPLRLPLTGLKFVVNGLGGGRVGTLHLRDLTALEGTVQRRTARLWSGPAEGHPCLTITPAPGVTILGNRAVTAEGLVAMRGAPGERQVFSALASLPVPFLVALCEEAGVHRYVTRPDVLVQGDAGLLALHSAEGGPCELRLPAPEEILNASTGETLGTGMDFRLELAPTSTLLLERRPVRAAAGNPPQRPER